MKLTKPANIKEIQSMRIKECMKKCGLSQKEVAQKINYTPQHLSYVLNGRRNLTADMAKSLANLFSEYLDKDDMVFEIPSEIAHFFTNDPRIYENGVLDKEFVLVGGEIPRISAEYLLGKTDYENGTFSGSAHIFHHKIKKDEQVAYIFYEGVQKLLQFYGYEIDIAYCPDYLYFGDPTPGDTVLKSFNERLKQESTLKEKSTGVSLSLSPLEAFQLMQDYSEAVMNITKRFFERQKFCNAIPSLEAPYTKDNELLDEINFIPDRSPSDDNSM